MLSKELLEILVCPKCKGDLEYETEKQRLNCHACKLRYVIQDDIPIMLIDQAESFTDEAEPAGGGQSATS